MINFIIFGAAALIFLFIFFYFVPVGLYFYAKLSGIEISLFELTKIRFKKVDTKEILRYLIALKNIGLNVHHHELVKHLQAGGSIENVLKAMELAKDNNITMDFKKVIALDLAGFNILKEVHKKIEKRKNNH